MNKISESSPAVGQLLALVRASLWQTPIDCGPFTLGAVDWDAIGRMAMQQTVGSLAINAAIRLPAELRPPKDWLHKAYPFIERNRLTHSLLDHTAAEVFARLKEDGLSPVLLKGQAYARAYPDPTLRQCGDIDIFVGEDNYHRAYLAAKKAGWMCEDKFRPDAKHYCCTVNGVSIELHRIAGYIPYPAANRRFQEWSRQQLTSSENTMIIGGEPIKVPTPLFDVVFVFMHLYLHFIIGGIGLRHICDWAMLLHAHHKEIDVECLEKLLKEFHLLNGWRYFAPIAVSQLGLPENECPFYSPEYGKEAERIFSYIIKEGNFGRAKQKPAKIPKGYVARKAYSFRIYTAQLFSKLWVDPWVVLMYYADYVGDGTARVIKDMFAR